MGKLRHLAQPIATILRQVPVEVFIETGTFHGESLEYALTLPFHEWHTVELSIGLHAAAQDRFSSIRELTLHHGDSATVLPEILDHLNKPAFIWLDAHYCFLDSARGPKDCPLVEEVEAVAAHERRTGVEHVIVVDDHHILGTSPTSEWLIGDEAAFVPEADWSDVSADRIESILRADAKQFHVWGDALFALPLDVDVSSIVAPPNPFEGARVTRGYA